MGFGRLRLGPETDMEPDHFSIASLSVCSNIFAAGAFPKLTFGLSQPVNLHNIVTQHTGFEHEANNDDARVAGDGASHVLTKPG